MDAKEERGYLRLLLHAASEPDCGLPDDDAELADISLLGAGWFQPTEEQAKRFRGQTSGDKLRACFVAKDGRLYNTRLLREFEYQRASKVQRSEAGIESARKRNGRVQSAPKVSDSEQALDSRCDSVGSPVERNGQRKLNNDVCVCVSDTVPDTVSDTSSEENKNRAREKTKTLALVPTRLQKLFEIWFERWSKVRGSNHRIQAAQAWLSVVTEANAEAARACADSYLASLDNPAKGYNPDTFLFEQAKDNFSATWPPSRASPHGKPASRTHELFRLAKEKERQEKYASG